ncbi:MAG: hypothetical protein BMS9Abin36_0804 [Gammaproteobacteria bacterium]|nr:MAG: hypothetical protein BMS9Abin36_0804 [Gammaproteobacteria bacterium]
MDTNREQILERARKLYFQGKYNKALELYLPFAETGHVDSQVFVGWLYSKGSNDVEKNLEQAKRWLVPAAKSGNVDAIYLLGTVYYMLGDYNQAVSIFNHAAELGYSAAYYQLGKIYFTAEVVEKDIELAYKYFKKASDLGHIFAKREVALMLIKGYQGSLNIPKGMILLAASIVTGIYKAFKDPYGEITFE